MFFQIFYLILILNEINCDFAMKSKRDQQIERFFKSLELSNDLKTKQLSSKIKFNNRIDLSKNNTAKSSKIPVNKSMLKTLESFDMTTKTLVDFQRYKLSSDNFPYKSVAITKDEDLNIAILFINNYVQSRENNVYPYAVTQIADQVYFVREVFEDVFNFFFSTKREYHRLYSNCDYYLVKHLEFQNFEHLTILMKLQPNQTVEKYIYRGVVLNLKEYQSLISRASQLLQDMESIDNQKINSTSRAGRVHRDEDYSEEEDDEQFA